MWSTISRLFSKSKNTEDTVGWPENQGCDNNVIAPEADTTVNDCVTMDRNAVDERRKVSGASADTGLHEPQSDSRQAKQRASVKWLLSKAYNNRVPDKLKEPYYRDHEDQEHLKPKIVHALSNAELYCLALANIYSDPNYHNQNHSGILQALARKGVYVAEPNSSPLTETILIQNSPLKMSAHMAVIEGLMVLYAKEVVTGDRVVAAIQRFEPQAQVEVPADHERGLLLWIGHASQALISKIQAEDPDKTRLPELPSAKDFQSLCDGVGLAAVVAFYCPGELNWMDIRVSKRSSVADVFHNLSLVHAFCNRCLPYPIFHMQPEDVTYMRGSMKQNLLAFLADMYNVLEIHPAKCVCYPGEDRGLRYLDECPRNSHGVAHKRSLPQSAVTPIPDLRSNLSESAPAFKVPKPASSTTVRKSQSLQQTIDNYTCDDRRGGDENFVVHRGRGVPTLSSVADEKLIGRAEAAGRPSNWEDQRRSSYGGRRSRRNSVSDDSQLTIENFGGSQDNLHNFGQKNPDKEVGAHIGRKTVVDTAPAQPVRSSVQDVYGSGVQLILADNGYANDDPPPTRLRRHASNSSLDNSSFKITQQITQHNSSDNDPVETAETTKMASFANLGRQADRAINLNYTDQEESRSSFKKPGQTNGNGLLEKKMTFATLPNTTTWQQQADQQTHQNDAHDSDDNGSSALTCQQLRNVRLQLEEKKRSIENDKRKYEVAVSKKRQQVGKAAFLQAVTKGKIKSPASSASGGDDESPMGTNCSTPGEASSSNTETSVSPAIPQDKPQRPFSLKEINEDVRDVEHKWLEHDGNMPFVETRRTPDIENMDLEQCHQSITQMNCSLSDLQADIIRLASQQNQIQQQHLMTQQQQQMQQQLQQLQSLSQQHHLQNYGIATANPLVTPRLSTDPIPQPGQFYLHDQPQLPRRTWGQLSPAQSLATEMAAVGYPQTIDSRIAHQPTTAPPPVYQQNMGLYQDVSRAWNVHPAHSQHKGFVLHDASQEQRYLNGGDHSLCNNQLNHPVSSYQASPTLYNQTPPLTASPQHRNAVHRISQLINDSPEPKKPTIHNMTMTGDSPIEKRQSAALHTPVPAPSVDDMEPQNISFIGNDDDLSQDFKGLHITSGSRTYRIPSPTRRPMSQNSFQPHTSLREVHSPPSNSRQATPPQSNEEANKGFYISFDDDDAPKKPKPILRAKKSSPKKERAMSSYIEQMDLSQHSEFTSAERQRLAEDQKEYDKERQMDERARREAKEREIQREAVNERPREKPTKTSEELVIGSELKNLDPNSIDEMEKKKERIMLSFWQRKQQQEELRIRNEAQAQARREREKHKEEQKLLKKEQEKQRRAQILEQHKLKKAIEEAEREGKVLDKDLQHSLKPMKRNKPSSSKARPRTIHVDSASELDSGVLTPSRGKKGSSSNLSTAGLSSSTMRRDYYRGSQDSLTAAHLDDRRSGSLYRGGSLRVSSVDSPDDGRGSSPCRSVNQLGRRGSYKTSRDAQEPQQQVRGRPKYTTYQNFKGRKSNSMMNLCDTDSGLGLGTPPRRAPSPGMGSVKHLTSPSGPGSLPPGLMTKKKVFDDGSSDISCTPSSMMEYNGPRLYKQPITKSNRVIMLNAVEYCVFPGIVNREAKKRVLDEINRSESKHFLILFRDAGCQFRALYSYNPAPEREEIYKLYGTGPKQVHDKMFDLFFKYNSGTKCFSLVHTKHITVTIDAFTIHNSLWQGKKVNLPNKKDMPLVI